MGCTKGVPLYKKGSPLPEKSQFDYITVHHIIFIETIDSFSFIDSLTIKTLSSKICIKNLRNEYLIFNFQNLIQLSCDLVDVNWTHILAVSILESTVKILYFQKNSRFHNFTGRIVERIELKNDGSKKCHFWNLFRTMAIESRNLDVQLITSTHEMLQVTGFGQFRSTFNVRDDIKSSINSWVVEVH